MLRGPILCQMVIGIQTKSPHVPNVTIVRNRCSPWLVRVRCFVTIACGGGGYGADCGCCGYPY